MRNNVERIAKVALLILFVFLGGAGFSRPGNAQNQELQERVAEMKEAAAKNKQAMAQYTWVEQINISLKGRTEKAGALPGSPWTRRKATEDLARSASRSLGGRWRPTEKAHRRKEKGRVQRICRADEGVWRSNTCHPTKS